MVRGCWRWDPNPQGLAPNGLRFRRVYRFRHASTQPAANHGSPRGKTQGIVSIADRVAMIALARSDPTTVLTRCVANERRGALDAFTQPDPEYKWMVTEARAKLEALARGR